MACILPVLRLPQCPFSQGSCVSPICPVIPPPSSSLVGRVFLLTVTATTSPEEEPLLPSWYCKPAGQSDEEACYEVGLIYETGNNQAKRSFLKAAKRYKSLDRDDVNKRLRGKAICGLGRLYLKEGCPLSRIRAADYFERSASDGDTEAMIELAYCFQHGTGRQKNLKKANDWFLEAGKKGNAEGYLTLGTNCWHAKKDLCQLTQDWSLENPPRNQEVAFGKIYRIASLYNKQVNLGPQSDKHLLRGIYTLICGMMSSAFKYWELASKMGDSEAAEHLEYYSRIS